MVLPVWVKWFRVLTAPKEGLNGVIKVINS